jgi:ketosteroid isomerase-like protein
MHPNAKLIDKFYKAFARGDYKSMQACYAPDIDFADQVFTLQGKRAGAMWHMLLSGSTNLKVVHSKVAADEKKGSAHWDADYTFSRTKRPVHNVLDAEFQFRDGKIIRHRDHFSFWKWSRQALGPTGLLLGWTPIVHNQVRKTAAENLEKFIAAHPEYQ